jgi:hypothetical protein
VSHCNRRAHLEGVWEDSAEQYKIGPARGKFDVRCLLSSQYKRLSPPNIRILPSIDTKEVTQWRKNFLQLTSFITCTTQRLILLVWETQPSQLTCIPCIHNTYICTHIHTVAVRHHFAGMELLLSSRYTVQLRCSYCCSSREHEFLDLREFLRAIELLRAVKEN